MPPGHGGPRVFETDCMVSFLKTRRVEIPIQFLAIQYVFMRLHACRELTLAALDNLGAVCDAGRDERGPDFLPFGPPLRSAPAASLAGVSPMQRP
jgi:hypothetical protein